MQTTTRIHSGILERCKEAATLILQLEQEIFQKSIDRELAQAKLDLFNAELDLEIAEDPSLRNEGMRKAQKTISQNTNPQFLELNNAVKLLDAQIKKLEMERDFRKRDYAIAKLETRLEIANLQETEN